MKKQPVVLFGDSTFASIAWFCLTNDSRWDPVAFTVDRGCLTKTKHEGLPMVPFEDLPNIYSPDSTKISIPLGYSKINGLRMARFNRAVELGYEPISYISTKATVWPGLNFGKNCLIFEQVIMQPFARIGNNVIVRSAANIGHHCVIGSHSFVSSGVTFGGNVTAGERCFFGLGAIIRNAVNIADRTFIGAGAVVLADTEPDGVYVGNPARKIPKTSLEVSGG